MTRLFVNKETISDTYVILSKDSYHYINDVLRLKKNDTLEIIVSEEELWKVLINSISKKELQFTVKEKRKTEQKKLKITLAQCLPKGDKMSELIQSCTELGIDSIIPVINSRSIPKLDDKKSKTKTDRWKKIAEHASIQSKRTQITKIEEILNFDAFLKHIENENFDLKIVPWEGERSVTLKKVLSTKKEKKNILIFIGPEGGISEQEIEKLEKNDFMTCTIADTILRTEHAGFLTLANIIYEYSE